MQRQTLVPVLDEVDARWSEHTCSILAGSYNFWGGLNGAIAGPQTVETSLRNTATDFTWKNAARASIAQRVYARNALQLKRDLEVDRFCAKYKEDGSEVEDFARVKQSLKQSEKGLGEALLEKGEVSTHK
ncbi:hypothetical protein BDZ45DRAFT_486882 [Acephala macrosclerotiorum]|nr:hypothetical protein BDZ45DRAFT_486882 [Acephala macrosclerotiorum]